MKTKFIFSTIIIFLVFISNFATAQKADFSFSMPYNYGFVIGSMDGASSVSIQVSEYGQSSYITIPGLGGISSAGTYNVSASTMQAAFGYGDFQCRVQDNFNVNHVSQSIRFTIP